MTKPTATIHASVERQLVTSLFNQRSALIAGNLALLIAALAGYLETAQRWFLVWALAGAITFAVRVAFEYAFDRHSKEQYKITFWRRWYAIGAWATGVLLGCSALVIVYHLPPLVQMLILSTNLVFVMGSVTRLSACPTIAQGQALLGIGPPFVVCLITNDLYYRVFSLAMVFELFAAFALTRYIHIRTVRLLYLNEQNTALAADVQRTNEELVAANARLETAATTDSLTGIANRRRFDAVLNGEISRVEHGMRDMALLMLDIDSFKGFNDLYGHQAGDDCLRRVAQALAASLRRPGDFIARYGGEEFVAVLPQTDVAGAAAFAETLRATIAALAIVNAAAVAGIVTVSIGVTAFPARRDTRFEEFVRAADEALYAAKGLGRNRVCVASVDRSIPSPRAPADVLVGLEARG